MPPLTTINRTGAQLPKLDAHTDSQRSASRSENERTGGAATDVRVAAGVQRLVSMMDEASIRCNARSTPPTRSSDC
jgi:hypothetical protein